MNPKISIIIPVYKAEKYIHECIDSILAQTLTEFELILINDGSPDKSGDICDKYAEKDNRIKVIHKKNEGPSIARNIGINIAKGKYIGFVDSDDVISNDMYEKMYNNIINNNSDIVICGYSEINISKDKTTNLTNPLNGKNFIEGRAIRKEFEELISKNTILGYASLWNKLYCKKFIVKNNILINEKLKIAEDLCFNIEAILKAEKISSVNEALYSYRKINENSITNSSRDIFYEGLNASKEILKTLEKNKICYDIYNKCEKYENSKIIMTYANRINGIIKSNLSIIQKYNEIKSKVNEKYYIDCLKNFDKKELSLKLRVFLIVSKLFINT